MLTQESISRKEFLRSIGLGGAALMAVLTSCQNGDGTVTPSGGSIDLSSAITTVGSYTYSGGIIVVRVASGNAASSFVALAKSCTHEGTTVNYKGNGIFHCPNHGAEFNSTGAVTLGPASKALTKYTVAITGTTLTIS
jgi:cytochrome b6-f complex iron-sulfur subunit